VVLLHDSSLSPAAPNATPSAHPARRGGPTRPVIPANDGIRTIAAACFNRGGPAAF